MDARIARLVELTDKTLVRREAATLVRLNEAAEREAAAFLRGDGVFQAMWSQKYRAAQADLEVIVAVRQIKDWAR